MNWRSLLVTGRAAATTGATRPAAAGGQEKPAEPKEPPPPANPFKPANDQLREVSKWLIGAFAAVGAVMLAGTQLSSIGSLSGEHPGRLVTALAAALVVVLATCRAIYLLTTVLTLKFSGMHGLVAMSREQTMGEVLAADTGYLAGRPNVKALFDDYDDAREVERAAHTVRLGLEREAAGHASAPKELADRLAVAKAQEKLAERETEHLRTFVRMLIQMKGHFDVWSTFRDVRRGVLLMAVLSAVGIIVFAWAANPPKADTASKGTPVVQPRPVEARLVLTPGGQADLGGVLGAECAARAASAGVPVVALAVDEDFSEVVVLGADPCTTTRLSVSAELGRVVPAGTVVVPMPTGT